MHHIDNLKSHVQQEMQRLNRKPVQIQVIGFFDSPMWSDYKPISSDVSPTFKQMAQSAIFNGIVSRDDSN